jgi:RHS repeat-associated protein
MTRDAWGNSILIAGSNAIALGFPGQWKDLAAGLYHNWNRDYDPALGRYMEADPIGLAGGNNVYGYGWANPANLTDPMGLGPTGSAVGGILGGWGGRIVGGSAGGAVGGPPGAAAGGILGGIGGRRAGSAIGSAIEDACKGAAAGGGGEDGRDPRCHKASAWELRQAGIYDEHQYKIEHDARPPSRFDICKCKDGSIRIAPVGQCGRTRNFWN